MIYFGDIEAFDAYAAEKYGAAAVDNLYHRGIQTAAEDIVLSVVYYPDINEYRGNVSLQMVMRYYQ